MFTNKSATIALITITIVFLLAFTAAAEEETSFPPVGPCNTGSGVPTISNDQTDNPDMAFNVTSDGRAICVSPGDTIELTIDVGLPSGEYEWTLTQDSGSGLSVGSNSTNEPTNTFSAEEDATGSATITVSDPDGHDSSQGTVLVKNEDMEFVFGSDNEDVEIQQNGSSGLLITGGNPPYQWSVSDSHFYFIDQEGNQTQQIETASGGVTLYADDTACGAVNITITDACGETANGQVRATGRWVEVNPPYCASPGPPTYVQWATRIRKVGQWKMVQQADYWWVGGSGLHGCEQPISVHICDNCPLNFCDTPLGCEECIETGRVPYSTRAGEHCGGEYYTWVECNCVDHFSLYEWTCPAN